MSFNTQAAIKAGYSPQEINQFLSKQQASNAPKKVGGMKSLVANMLPLIGGTVGAVGGSVLAPVLGTAVGGAGGSALGEFARQKLLGEKTNWGSIAGQGALGAIPGALGAAGQGLKIAKGAMGAKAALEAGTAVKGAGATAKALEGGSEAMAAAQKAENVPAVGKSLTKVVAPPTERYQTQFIKQPTAPVETPALKVEAPVNKPVLTPEPAATVAKPTLAPAPQEIAPAAVSEPLPKPVSKLEKFAQGRDQSNKNMYIKKAGSPTKGGDYLTFDKQQKIDEYVKSKGIKASTPENYAKQVEANHATVTKNLDTHVDAINRPLTAAEREQIVSKYEENLANSSATDRKAAETYIARIKDSNKVKDIKDLEALRKEADTAAFTDRGAGNTSKAIQAEKARTTIDKFITPLSGDYKAAKGEWKLSQDAARQTAQASNSTQGPRVFGYPVATQSLAGTVGRGNEALAKVARGADKLANGVNAGAEQGAKKTMTNQGYMPYVKAGVKQSLSRAIAGPLLPDGMKEPQAAADTQAAVQYEPPTPSASTNPAADNGPFSDPLKVQQAYMAALADGDTKAASMIMDGFKAFGPAANNGNKPLSTAAATAIANANAGIQSIDNVIAQMQQDPSVQKKSIIPGRGMFGGAGANLLGTGQYDASIQQAKDIVQRLRTGAAISTQEAGFYNQMMPQAFDTPETTMQKLQILKTMFQTVATRGQNGTVSDGTNNDNTAALLSNAGVQ